MSSAIYFKVFNRLSDEWRGNVFFQSQSVGCNFYSGHNLFCSTEDSLFDVLSCVYIYSYLLNQWHQIREDLFFFNVIKCYPYYLLNTVYRL